MAIIDMTSGTPGNNSQDELTADKIFEEFIKEDDKPSDDDKDTLELLSDDKKKPIKDKDDEDETDDETKKKKDEKLELDEEEPTDEDLDNVEEVPRAAILKEYPELFKKFPQLEHAYYREKKYAELLPTLDDARQAVDKSQAFDKYAQSVNEGNLDGLLAEVKSNDEDAFGRIVDNYLPNLAKTDKDAYFHVVGNVIKNTISAMAVEGHNTENDQLKAAAIILNQFIFGNSTYKAPISFGKPQDTKSDEIKNERQKLTQEKFDGALEDLSTKSSNIIKSTISKYIDPKDSMTDYVKRTAINEALTEVQNSLSNDTRFRATIDKLWQKVFETNFSRISQENVRKAYLNRARAVLPDIIKKHRNAALKGLGKRVTDDREEPADNKRGPIARGRSIQTEKREKKPNEIPATMKTYDYLMSDD